MEGNVPIIASRFIPIICFVPIVLPLFPFLVSLLSLADVFVSLRNLIMGELEVCS